MRRRSPTRRTALAAAFVAASAYGAAVQAASPDDPDRVTRIAGLDVALWQPGGGQGPHPLVLFSHGMGGCKTQSSRLMRSLAREGMLVAAPDHADKGARCPEQVPGAGEIMHAIERAGPPGPSFFEQRRKDMEDLRTGIAQDTALSRAVDASRVALIGHSLGGYTVLGLAGGWPQWKTGGIAAVVALAPYVQPFANGGTPAGISVPVLFQAGENDGFAPDAIGFHTRTRSPSCRVVYRGADHFAWTDVQTGHQGLIAADAAAFLKAVFAGNTPTSAILTQRPAGVPDCR